jgi:O-antigen ligase
VPVWPWAWKKRGVLVAAGFAVVTRFVIPGLLGTVKSLFVNIANDPSTTGRTQDYSYFAELFRERPILGRGFYTFLPQIYTVFDNQYLVILVEMGVIGLLAMSGIFICGIGAGRAARAAAQDDETRHLGQVLAGSIAGGAVAFATFDGFSFPQASGLLFLLIGSAGALRRLTRAELRPADPVPDEEPELVRVAVGPGPTEPTDPSIEPVADAAPPRTVPRPAGRRRYWFNNPS